MRSVQRTLTPVQRVLRDRPYLAWHLIPLAAYLCVQEYSDPMRNRIIDWVIDGGLLESAVVDGILERGDLAYAQYALDSGRMRRARQPAPMLPPIRGGAPVGDELPSLLLGNDEPFLPGPDDDREPTPAELDAVYDIIDAPVLSEHQRWVREVEAQRGLPPVSGGSPDYQPTAADWADYHRACDEADAREAMDARRRGVEIPRYGYE